MNASDSYRNNKSNNEVIFFQIIEKISNRKSFSTKRHRFVINFLRHMEYRTSKQAIVFTRAEIVHDTLAFIRVSIKKKKGNSCNQGEEDVFNGDSYKRND